MQRLNDRRSKKRKSKGGGKLAARGISAHAYMEWISIRPPDEFDNLTNMCQTKFIFSRVAHHFDCYNQIYMYTYARINSHTRTLLAPIKFEWKIKLNTQLRQCIFQSLPYANYVYFSLFCHPLYIHWITLALEIPSNRNSFPLAHLRNNHPIPSND